MGHPVKHHRNHCHRDYCLYSGEHFCAIESCPRHTYPEDPHFYHYAIHWCWQTALKYHIWVSEVYESVSFPITVSRTKTWKEFLGMTKKRISSRNNDWFRLFHFDFDVEVNTRKLDQKIWPRIHLGLKPADVRFMKDLGEPDSQPDRFIFCVACKPFKLKKLRTIDLQEATALQVARVRLLR